MCTSHFALLSYWVGSHCLWAFRSLDYVCRCRRLILCPSLTLLLKSDSPEDPPDDVSALGDANPSPSEEVVLRTLLRASDTSDDTTHDNAVTSERNAAPVPTPERRSLSRAELRGVLHALRGRRAGERLVTVLDCEYVFKGITEWTVKWKRHGWCSRGKEIGQRDLWQEIWRPRQAAGSQVVVLWMPPHLNAKGNDEADVLAEAGHTQLPHNKRRRQEEQARP